jgi:hypothetical protein
MVETAQDTNLAIKVGDHRVVVVAPHQPALVDHLHGVPLASLTMHSFHDGRERTFSELGREVVFGAEARFGRDRCEAEDKACGVCTHVKSND